jgi:hypothetical protein
VVHSIKCRRLLWCQVGLAWADHRDASALDPSVAYRAAFVGMLGFKDPIRSVGAAGLRLTCGLGEGGRTREVPEAAG